MDAKRAVVPKLSRRVLATVRPCGERGSISAGEKLLKNFTQVAMALQRVKGTHGLLPTHQNGSKMLLPPTSHFTIKTGRGSQLHFGAILSHEDVCRGGHRLPISLGGPK